MISKNIKTIIDLSLGDGCLRKREKDTYPIIDMTHSIRQQQYAEHKATLLREAGLTVVSKEIKGTGKNTGKQYYRVYSWQHPFLHTAHKYLYNSGRKAIDKHLLKLLDEASFAYYFLDDGGVSTTILGLSKTVRRIYTQRFAHRYGIAAMAFSREENLLFIDWMQATLNLRARLYTEKKTGSNWIYISDIENMNRLRTIVLPYATDDMLYKFSYQHGSKGIPATLVAR